MNNYSIELLKISSSNSSSEELEKYLSDAVICYGIDQLNGEKPTKLYCCSKDNDRNIVGGIMGYVTRNLFFITHLFVEQKHRKKGIGEALLSAIEKAAKEQNCNIVRLNTLNKGARSLYGKAGFEETTSIKEYMNGFDLLYYHKYI
jgi:GNAT superfamily N-acetyltransferase